ncbi:hypothetical protein BESB_029110 [Besnoitia besnoiti]|uniref:Uncharacterized protein n=1 Tax=Besnoitia besnoiti TaxID=94643 RepID=A0A2A9M6G6_BESBE|nr:uncharacterized protein BESB_029110 [Besnoitia besnoiti]PFH31476.1 hypothetical protein BESB_029110 [Besnoitia besnoiti]
MPAIVQASLSGDKQPRVENQVQARAELIAEKQRPHGAEASSSTIGKLGCDVPSLRRDVDGVVNHITHRAHATIFESKVGLPAFYAESKRQTPMKGFSTRTGIPALAPAASRGRSVFRKQRGTAPSMPPERKAAVAGKVDTGLHSPTTVKGCVGPQQVHRKANRFVGKIRLEAQRSAAPLTGKVEPRQPVASGNGSPAPYQAKMILQDLNSVLQKLSAVSVFDNGIYPLEIGLPPCSYPGSSSEQCPMSLATLPLQLNWRSQLLPPPWATRPEKLELNGPNGPASSPRGVNGSPARKLSRLPSTKHCQHAAVRRISGFPSATAAPTETAKVSTTATRSRIPGRLSRAVAEEGTRSRDRILRGGAPPAAPPHAACAHVPPVDEVVEPQNLIEADTALNLHCPDDDWDSVVKMHAYWPFSPEPSLPAFSVLSEPTVAIQSSTTDRPLYFSHLLPGPVDLPHRISPTAEAPPCGRGKPDAAALDSAGGNEASLRKGRQALALPPQGHSVNSGGRCPWHGSGKRQAEDGKKAVGDRLGPSALPRRTLSQSSGQTLQQRAYSHFSQSGLPQPVARIVRTFSGTFLTAAPSGGAVGRRARSNRRTVSASSRGSLRHPGRAAWRTASADGKRMAGSQRPEGLSPAPASAAGRRWGSVDGRRRGGPHKRCRRCEACDPTAVSGSVALWDRHGKPSTGSLARTENDPAEASNSRLQPNGPDSSLFALRLAGGSTLKGASRGARIIPDRVDEEHREGSPALKAAAVPQGTAPTVESAPEQGEHRPATADPRALISVPTLDTVKEALGLWLQTQLILSGSANDDERTSRSSKGTSHSAESPGDAVNGNVGPTRASEGAVSHVESNSAPGDLPNQRGVRDVETTPEHQVASVPRAAADGGGPTPAQATMRDDLHWHDAEKSTNGIPPSSYLHEVTKRGGGAVGSPRDKESPDRGQAHALAASDIGSRSRATRQQEAWFTNVADAGLETSCQREGEERLTSHCQRSLRRAAELNSEERPLSSPAASSLLPCAMADNARRASGGPLKTACVERSCSPVNRLPPFRKERAVSPILFHTPSWQSTDPARSPSTAARGVLAHPEGGAGPQRHAGQSAALPQPTPVDALSPRPLAAEAAAADAARGSSLLPAREQLVTRKRGSSPVHPDRKTCCLAQNVSQEQCVAPDALCASVDLQRFRRTCTGIQVMAGPTAWSAASSPESRAQAVDRSVGPTTSGSLFSPCSSRGSVGAEGASASPGCSPPTGRAAASQQVRHLQDANSHADPLPIWGQHSRIQGSSECRGLSPVMRTDRGSSPIGLPNVGKTHGDPSYRRVRERIIWSPQLCLTEPQSVAESSTGSVSSGEVLEDSTNGVLAYFSRSPRSPTGSRGNQRPGNEPARAPFLPCSRASRTYGDSQQPAFAYLPTAELLGASRRETSRYEPTAEQERHGQLEMSPAPPVPRRTFGASFSGQRQVLLLLSDGRLAPARGADDLPGLLSPGEVVDEAWQPHAESRLLATGASVEDLNSLSPGEIVAASPPATSRSDCREAIVPSAFTSPDLSEFASNDEIQSSPEQPPTPAPLADYRGRLPCRMSPAASPTESDAEKGTCGVPSSVSISASRCPRSPVPAREIARQSPVGVRRGAARASTPESTHERNSKHGHATPAKRAEVGGRLAGVPQPRDAGLGTTGAADTGERAPVLPRTPTEFCSEDATQTKEEGQYAPSEPGLSSEYSAAASLCSAPSPPRRSSPPLPPHAADEAAVSSPHTPSSEAELQFSCRPQASGLRKMRPGPPLRPRPGAAFATESSGLCADPRIGASISSSAAPEALSPSTPTLSPQKLPFPSLLSPTAAEADASCPGEESSGDAGRPPESFEMTCSCPVPGWC